MKYKLALMMAIFVWGCDKIDHFAGDEMSADTGGSEVDREEPTAPGVPSEWQWSEEKVALTEQSAQNGDMAAARSLLQYYIIIDNINKSLEWEDWLVNKNDSYAMAIRSQRLFAESFHFPPRSEKRILALEEAKRLKEKSISLNGSSDPLELEVLQNMQQELERQRNLRAKVH